MRQIRIGSLMLLAVCAAALAVSASAFASQPDILPTTVTKWEGKNVGVAELSTLAGASSVVACKTATGEGTIVEGNHGTFKIDFKECKSGTTVCTGLGEAAGVILSSGNYLLVYDVLTTLGSAILFEPTETHFNCSALVLVLVKGQVLCLILTPLTLSTTHEFHCEKIAFGDPKETEYWNNSGTKVKITELLSSTNGATPVGSVELALGTIVTSPAVEVMD